MAQYRPPACLHRASAARKNLSSLHAANVLCVSYFDRRPRDSLNLAGPKADKLKHSRELHGPDCFILDLSWREKRNHALSLVSFFCRGKTHGEAVVD